MNHSSTQIRGLAEQGIAHDVEIGVARKAESLTEGRPTGLLEIDQKLEGIVEPHAAVERDYARSAFLIVWAEAVRPAVERAKIGMSLENEVGLTGEPEACALDVRQHRFGAVIGGGIR